MTVEQQIADMQQASVEQTQASQALADEVAGKMGEIDSKVNDTTSFLENDYQEKTSSLTITASLGYKNAVEKASGGRNTLIIDDQGNENIMVVIPRFNCEDINDAVLAKTGVDMQLGLGTHPAFKSNGVDRGEILIGKYLASDGDNGGCSVIGGVQPKTSVNYDAAKSLCTNKGEGWHMMSIHEWAAIALWSLANGSVPRGNTNYGRAHDAKWETALRSDRGLPGDSSGVAINDTGSGPDKWAHDHGTFGVQDLVGNVWEWVDQMKLEEGQIISTLNNDASVAEDNWYRHSAFFDSTSNATEGSNVGAPILNSGITNRNGSIGDDSHNAYVYNSLVSSISKDPSYVESEIMRRLLVEFSEASASCICGGAYIRNYGHRFPLRGGSWSNGTNAGLGALYLTDPRSYGYIGIGFRPAYFL